MMRLSRHWAWLRPIYWCYRNSIDWLFEDPFSPGYTVYQGQDYLWNHTPQISILYRPGERGVLPYIKSSHRWLKNSLSSSPRTYTKYGHIPRDAVLHILLNDKLSVDTKQLLSVGAELSIYLNIAPYNDCIRVAQDRERWRSMTADPLTTDGTQRWWISFP